MYFLVCLVQLAFTDVYVAVSPRHWHRHGGRRLHGVDRSRTRSLRLPDLLGHGQELEHTQTGVVCTENTDGVPVGVSLCQWDATFGEYFKLADKLLVC